MSMFSLLYLLIQKCIQWTLYGVPFVAPFVPCWWGKDIKSSNDALSAGPSVPGWNLLYRRQRMEMSHNNDYHSSSAPPRICWDWWCGLGAWKLGQEVLWHISPRQVTTNVTLFCVWNMGRGEPHRIKNKGDLVFFLISEKENLQRADNKRYFENLAIILAFQSCWFFFLY